MNDPRPWALTIAGSDPTGGAGLQADLKVFSVALIHGASVTTAITAQSPKGARATHPLPATWVSEQLEPVLTDLPIAAIKSGMLGDAQTIAVIAAHLAAHPNVPYVLDPVLVASSGLPLLDPDAIPTLRDTLLPRATILTPNRPEAATLLDTDQASIDTDPLGAAQALLSLGPQAVLLKGGHSSDDPIVDLWLDQNGVHVELTSPRIETTRTHGTGCTLSAALAAALAHGDTPLDAADRARTYMTEVLKRSVESAAHNNLKTLYALWEPDAENPLIDHKRSDSEPSLG